MSVAVITGSTGLIGCEAAAHFADMGLNVVGIDNDMRRVFFGDEASTAWNRGRLERTLGRRYTHVDIDVRDRDALMGVIARYGRDIELIIHAAAQPSHDWAARQPFVDFDINALGTLNVLEAARQHCSDATFVFTSTNKVYGDMPNYLPLVELETRWELEQGHTYWSGIREDMSIDNCLHSMFGASKVSADILVQEYGRYYGMNTACFRGGTLTGPQHSGAELHGFLSYIMRCAMTRTTYTVYGYKGKQVRDAIHSRDLVQAFSAFLRTPRSAQVYNIGGGRSSNVSVLEAIAMCQEITGNEMPWTYSTSNRLGDHIWWISDNSRFEAHYPDWRLEYDVPSILREIYHENRDRWRPR
jgi:CDP-paratose 2-epimerase